MKILLLAQGCPPESVGGVEQHVEGLARALQAGGDEVEIFARTSTPGPQYELVEGECLGGIPVTRVRYRWEGLESLADLYRNPQLEDALRTFLAGRSFDVAHAHHLTGLSTGSLAVLQAAGIPTALTLHDYWLMCPRGQMWHREGRACERVEKTQCYHCLQPGYGHWLGDQPQGEAALEALHQQARELFAAADQLITPSARTLPFFAPLGVEPGEVAVVENGVDTPALAQLPLPDPQDQAPLRLGYLGTLLPSKGLDVAIEALAGMPVGAASLDIYGNAVPYHGDEGFLTRAFGRLEPGMELRYHGPYRTADLPRILAGIDVLVAPALWHEAFGLTVREALAAGRPVLVSRMGGLQDAVEDGVEGRVLPPGDAVALRDAIAGLAADRPGLRRMAEAARRRTRGFAPMAAELRKIYARLVMDGRKA